MEEKRSSRSRKKTNDNTKRFYVSASVGLCLLCVHILSERLLSPLQEMMIVSVSFFLAVVVLLRTHEYLTCSISYTVSLFAIALYHVSLAAVKGEDIAFSFSFEEAFRAGLIWFCGFVAIIVFRLFSNGKWNTASIKKNFRTSFRFISATFFTVYIVLLIMLFVSRRSVGMYDERSINLLPFQGAFSVYWPQILSGQFRDGVFIQFFGNLFIFTPLGFFIPVFFPNIRKGWLILIPILLAGSIETTQYILNTGKSDIDDLWMNVVGFWVGSLLFYSLGTIRSIYTHGKEKRIIDPR
jgi:glycopeptide antibiotics resistance protein